MNPTIELADAAATRSFGAHLGRMLRAGDLVVLNGGLGAGKTTLTQGIGAGLGVRGPVVSPTFTIARVLPSLVDGPDLVHVDAYRLSSWEDLETLDLETSLDEVVTVVEWGAGWVEQLALERLEIVLERPVGQIEDPQDGAAGVRQATLIGYGDRWATVDFASRPGVEQ